MTTIPANPRTWSPNWGIAVFIASTVVGVAMHEFIVHDLVAVAFAIGLAWLVAAALVLGHLVRCRRREWGLMGATLLIALQVADVAAPIATAGWWAHVGVGTAACVAIILPLSLWLLRSDRRRATMSV